LASAIFLFSTKKSLLKEQESKKLLPKKVIQQKIPHPEAEEKNWID